MSTMFVNYARAPALLNREHWINVHTPLVRECRGPIGLERVADFSWTTKASA